jgi:hypothetical protein
MTVSYNTSVLKNYNATNSIPRFEKENPFPYCENALAYSNAVVVVINSEVTGLATGANVMNLKYLRQTKLARWRFFQIRNAASLQTCLQVISDLHETLDCAQEEIGVDVTLVDLVKNLESIFTNLCQPQFTYMNSFQRIYTIRFYFFKKLSIVARMTR